MIERLYLRELVTFSEAEVEFEKGLVVFTGPSGAGKSVLMSAILASFGHSTPGAAALCEVNLAKPLKLESEAYSLEEEVTIKTVKKEKVRHYIDGQNISKKALGELFAPYVQYLSVRDKGGFESEKLLAMIESSLLAQDKRYKKLSKEYKKRYATYKNQLLKLNKIREDEAKLTELIEFARYEVEKIEKIDPKVREDEELMQVKHQLSRIDKIKEVMQHATAIFDAESSVQEVYRLLDKDASVFTDALNQVRADFEETESLAEELEEMDVEQILDRLSDLTALKNRYGSVEEALRYKEEKKKELTGYENIEQDKSMLENFIRMEAGELNILAQQLSRYRQKEAVEIERKLSDYLAALKLPALAFTFTAKPFDESGSDICDVLLGGSRADTLSGGEFNRVRLALMASTIGKENRGGVLILDEIDANVSGDESIAIAEMIAQLSKVYQIFAISHQPHLSAKADQHLVVNKAAQKSEVRSLDDKERIDEIARIIAGENPTSQALEFAKKLRN
ncbi:AAA family ATPase [Sulfurovum mangrovi]|uniref:AAA family ATPase n=1 Tax=Sulfurovum mangrovi TaxID=2893889 RepID=UPI001E5C21B0|nr:AAA family ATPase [Sulfurovum mangrovi]UFH60283.1 DNA recombination protein RecN [Sulfurovum mangrovi]